MARDEKGNELSKEDQVCLRFPGGVKFKGRIESIRVGEPIRRGSKVRSGSVVIVSRHLVELEDFDSAVRGIAKYPVDPPDTYGGSEEYRKTSPKGVVRIPKTSSTRAKKRA